MFKISSDAIDPAALARELRDPRAGACATFEGWVRNRNDGRAVVALEYETHAVLAEREGGRILREALEKYPILRAVCVHRAGALDLGELAVWVGVAAEHRGAAFEACRYIIDQTKLRVPIWKKEHYADGTVGWVDPTKRKTPGA
jgi:molybdopterin synthase catalytic subunit